VSCGKEKSNDEFYSDASRKDGIDVRCKECAKYKSLIYRKNNSDKVVVIQKNYYRKNSDKLIMEKRKWRIKKAKFSSFKHYTEFYTIDKIQEGNNNELLALCKYCNIYFNPTNKQVQHRIGAFYNRIKDNIQEDWIGIKNDLYCSDKCKLESPIRWVKNNPYLLDKYSKKWYNLEWKANIRNNRDLKRCWYPNCLCDDIDLVLHHIDYNKRNCEERNLITICRSANVGAEKNKEVHIAYFEELMKHRGYSNEE